jgi:hypothetical protein
VRAAKQSQLSRKTSMRRVREAQKMAWTVKMARIAKIYPTMARIWNHSEACWIRARPCYKSSTTKHWG